MVAPREQPQRTAPREMKGSVAIVTGGATGLGRAVALDFARRGVHVAFNYVLLANRDIAAQALLTETALRGLGIQVYCAVCDVRDSDAVSDFVAAAQAELGGVHYLVNNAGIAHDGALWRMSDDAWREVLETNVTGAFHCIRALAPTFRKQRYGKIVNIASHQAYTPGFGIANYAASKAALIGLTRAAAVDLGASNVNVNAVAPGHTATPMNYGPADLVAATIERPVIPAARAAFSRGITSRATRSSTIVFTATHSELLNSETVGEFNAGSTESTASRSSRFTLSIRPTCACESMAPRSIIAIWSIFCRFHGSATADLLAIR